MLVSVELKTWRNGDELIIKLQREQEEALLGNSDYLKKLSVAEMS